MEASGGGGGLRVDPAELKSAATEVMTASESAPPGAVGVRPCAPDVVSAGVSARLSEQMRLASSYTAAANRVAALYGVVLDANAQSYAAQEAASAATLGAGGPTAAAPTPPTATLPAGMPAASSAAPDLPAGEVPATPRDISRLIDSGPGTAHMRAAEAQLRSDATQLDAAAAKIESAINTANSGWASASADAATDRMRELHTWYRGHAEYVRGLADEVAGHVENFRNATTQVPRLKTVDDAERELAVAQENNRRSHGMFKPAVAAAQVKVGQVYQEAVSGFGKYTALASASSPRVPVPPPMPPGAAQTMSPKSSAGDSTPVEHMDRSATGDPVDPVDAGAGVDETMTSGGPVWPAGDVDPAGDAPLVDPLVSPAAEAVPQVVPAVIGGVVGGVGGVLGGLAGAGQRALSGVGQAAAPALSGLGQPSGGGEPGGGEPQSPEMPSSGGDFTPDDGGSMPGDTEASSDPGPLSASPAGAVPAPAAAAPVSAPAAATPAAGEATGGGPAMGGAMMPPLMGAPRGGKSGSDAERKLYRERRLKVVAPPNSEPVKGRREARRVADTERTSESSRRER
ncbi:PPE domain-containing protein [Mycobacterium heckeshornense]|uniref:PPE domain-containing protein n=2 Tax=Mycobacterium TaxID=1763 RepID=UPI0005EE5D80|nr:PPE domain-containing protein [Mycobacterium heckeshornense]MCV7034900.1 PPE domain-containing protein [Mycobacterium heckeshornense]